MAVDPLHLADVRALAESGEARRIRLDSRLPLRVVADYCGVSHVAIVRWERGERKPTGEPAMRYWRLLHRLRERLAA